LRKHELNPLIFEIIIFIVRGKTVSFSRYISPVNMKKFFNSRAGIVLLLTILTVVPIAVFVLPKTFFDGGPPLCIFTILADTECPGCGLTRGTMRLTHFDFAGAWEMNKLTFFVIPILAIWWVKQWIIVFKKYRNLPNKSNNTTVNN
jgi:hypothetical protein